MKVITDLSPDFDRDMSAHRNALESVCQTNGHPNIIQYYGSFQATPSDHPAVYHHLLDSELNRARASTDNN